MHGVEVWLGGGRVKYFFRGIEVDSYRVDGKQLLDTAVD